MTIPDKTKNVIMAVIIEAEGTRTDTIRVLMIINFDSLVEKSSSHFGYVLITKLHK
ncbi:MAG: hypothetical protein ACFFDE_12190 [Promethearchaeota archaeon]